MRGTPSKQGGQYKGHFGNSPFKRGPGDERMGLTSPSTSTSLNKFTFKRNAQIQIDEEKREIVGRIIGSGQGVSEGHANPLSMKDLRDLDVSPEKRWV